MAQTNIPASDFVKSPAFEPAEYCTVGGVILAKDPIEYNTGRATVKLTVRNTGDRPVQIGSHYHFFEVNRYMEFDRPKAFGYHLNIPATTAIRFEDLVNGYAGTEDSPTYYPKRTEALRRMQEYGYKSVSQTDEEGEYTQSQTQK